MPTGGIVFNLSSLIQQKKFKKWISAYSVDIGIDSVQINHFLSEWFFSFQSIRIAVWWTNLRLKVTRLKPAYGLQGLAGGIVGPWKCRFSLPTGVPEKCSFFPLMLCSFFMTDTSSVFSSFSRAIPSPTWPFKCLDSGVCSTFGCPFVRWWICYWFCIRVHLVRKLHINGQLFMCWL